MATQTRSKRTALAGCSVLPFEPCTPIYPVTDKQDSTLPETLASPLQGHIDRYDSGVLLGWAWDPNDSSSRIEVAIISEDEELGGGVADIYRQDLRESGVGDGRHGFEMRIRRPSRPGLTRLVLVDATSRERIGEEVFEFDLPDVAEGGITFSGLAWGALTGNLETVEDLGDTVVLTLTDERDQVIGKVEAKREGVGRYPFRYPLPPTLCDGNIHAITVSTGGVFEFIATHVDVFPHLLTPWSHLVKSALSLNYPQLPRTASFRYDSLRLQLDRLAAETAPGDLGPQVENIARVHRLVLEGASARKDFPRFALPQTDSPQVSVVVPAHNEFATTYHCLASLALAHNRCSFEVVLVDDASTDATLEVADLVSGLRVVRNETNRGFVRSCNRGVSESRGEFVVLLNNDTEVTSGWLDALLEPFSRFQDVGMTGAKLMYPDGTLQEAGGIVWGNGAPWNLGRGDNPMEPRWNYTRQVDYLSGAALMLPRKIWDTVGGLSDEFAPAYYEDTDLAFKVRDEGFRTVYAPYSTVIHYEGISNGRDLTQGVKKNQVINAPKFKKKWVDAYLSRGEPDIARVPQEMDRGVTRRALLIDHKFPTPNEDAGSYAAIQEIRLLQANGFKVSFLPANMAHLGAATDRLQRMGVECYYAPFYSSPEEVIRRHGQRFDLVYLTRYQIAEVHLPLVREHTRAKVLFNNADLHFLRELRAALASKNTDLSGPLATRDRELKVVREVDAVLSYNDTEHAVILSHTLRSENLFKCPWVLHVNEPEVAFKDRRDIGFLGGFRHHPNVEAVEYFVREVMPILRDKGAGITLRVFGSHLPDHLRRLEAPDVIMEGFVDDLDEKFGRIRVMVAPLLSGAGIKGKVLQAMAYGVPQVLSPVAIEATGLVHGQSAEVANTADEWAAAIARLYNSPDQWSDFSRASISHARRHFGFQQGVEMMKRPLEYLGLYAPKSQDVLCSNS